MNWLNLFKIIETLAAVLAQLFAAQPVPGATAAAAASADVSASIASVTATLATLSALAGTHVGSGVAPVVVPPATGAKVEAHEPYLKPLTGL
jgi:hypothetical protein